MNATKKSENVKQPVRSHVLINKNKQLLHSCFKYTKLKLRSDFLTEYLYFTNHPLNGREKITPYTPVREHVVTLTSTGIEALKSAIAVAGSGIVAGMNESPTMVGNPDLGNGTGICDGQYYTNGFRFSVKRRERAGSTKPPCRLVRGRVDVHRGCSGFCIKRVASDPVKGKIRPLLEGGGGHSLPKR